MGPDRVGTDHERRSLIHGHHTEPTSRPRKAGLHDENPKIAPDANDNQIKDPADWVTGDEPMTGAQASYLKTLCEQTQRPDMFDAEITKSEASKRIDVLRDSRQGYN